MSMFFKRDNYLRAKGIRLEHLFKYDENRPNISYNTLD